MFNSKEGKLYIGRSDIRRNNENKLRQHER